MTHRNFQGHLKHSLRNIVGEHIKANIESQRVKAITLKDTSTNFNKQSLIAISNK